AAAFLPLQDFVGRNDREEQVAAVLYPDGAFGPVVAAGQDLHLRPGRDQLVEAGILPEDRPERLRASPGGRRAAAEEDDAGQDGGQAGGHVFSLPRIAVHYTNTRRTIRHFCRVARFLPPISGWHVLCFLPGGTLEDAPCRTSAN